MTPTHADRVPFSRCAVVVRGLGWGSLFGVLAGAAAGTVLWPLVATFLGAVVGAIVGAGFGLVGGCVLALVDTGDLNRRWLSAVNATTSAGCGAFGASSAHLGAVTGPVFVVVSAVLGAAIGPRVARGPWGPERRLARPPRTDRAFTALLNRLACGAAAGFGTGAEVGAAVGVLGGSSTAVAAAAEGAFLGVPVGLLVGAVGTAVVVVVRR